MKDTPMINRMLAVGNGNNSVDDFFRSFLPSEPVCIICKGISYRGESVVINAVGLCPYCAEARKIAKLNRKTRELFINKKFSSDKQIPRPRLMEALNQMSREQD